MNMAAPYVIGEISNITSPIIIGNELMGNMMFGNLMLITIFLVTTFSVAGSSSGNIISGLQIGSLIALITNILLLPLGLVSPVSLIFWFVFLMASIFFTSKN